MLSSDGHRLKNETDSTRIQADRVRGRREPSGSMRFRRGEHMSRGMG